MPLTADSAGISLTGWYGGCSEDGNECLGLTAVKPLDGREGECADTGAGAETGVGVGSGAAAAAGCGCGGPCAGGGIIGAGAA